MKPYLRLLTAVAALAASPVTALPQTATPPTSTQTQQPPTPRPVPLDHLYWHFFVYQKHLDKVADEQDKHGKDGRWLRDHFQNELGFTQSDFVVIRNTGDTIITQVEQMRQKADTIHKADHAARKAGVFTRPEDSPGLPQLKQLNQDRDALMKTQLELMNQSLGPEKAKEFKDYLQKHLAANIQPLNLPPGTPAPVLGPRPQTAKGAQ